MKSFVRRRTKTAAECQAEQAEKKGKGAGRKWKGTRGSWGQAQIASFAFARTQDKAQEGTAEAAAERSQGEKEEQKHDDDADEAVRKTVGSEEGRQKELCDWLAAYPEGGKQGAARTHLPCHEPLTVSWRRCRCRCRCRCSFLTLRLVASHLKLC